MPNVVVTVTPTIVDGAVVRWYAAPQHRGLLGDFVPIERGANGA